MADGLEEPGWPNLHTPGVPSPGETFLNAFQAVSNVNARKQALEQQIAQINANMAIHQQAHDLDMQQFGWKQKMDLANLNRQDAAEKSLAVYRDRMASVGEDRLNLVLAQKDGAEQSASEYQDALSGLVGKYPETYQNQEFLNELSLVNQKYSTIAGTKEGKRVSDVFNRQIEAAQKQAHWGANQIRQNLDSTLQMQDRGGQGMSRVDLNRPDDAFRTIGGNKMISEYPVQIPGTNNVQWNTISPNELGQLSTADQQAKWPGMRTRSTPVNTWNSMKKLHDTMLKIGGPDINEKPAAGISMSGDHSVGDSVRLKNGSVVTIKSINPDGTFDY